MALAVVCRQQQHRKGRAMSDQTTSVWWAIQCKPRQETRAQANLESSGVRTFLPLARHAGSPRAVREPAAKVEPLFPRYLFARCDSPAMTHRIRFARGVTRILGTGNAPTSVDETIIAAIQQRMAGDGCVPLRPAFQPGDAVRIVDGPLKDFVGVFESSATADDRVRLLVAAVQGQWRVTVDGRCLEKA
jgi:transcriptional antiterminator RfaH